jgi:REP element-mobilizing transposase RayT
MDGHPTPERKRLRLSGFDYATPGAYFFTVVTVKRQPLFGRIDEEAMVMNLAGDAVTGVWSALPDRFRGVELDEFVVMPNHVHGILWLVGDEPSTTLGKVMRAFKSLSARGVNTALEREGAVWQRGFHERVVRNDEELRKFRKYIVENAARWALDAENSDGRFADVVLK